MDKMMSENYKLSDILEFENSFLGLYQEKPLNIKIGKYGPYFEWDNKNFGIKDIGIELCNIKLDNAVAFIENGNDQETDRATKMSEKSKTILRVVDVDTSIRKGKFGLYIYHKTSTMKKPKFITASNLNIDILTCHKTLVYNWMKSQSKK
jgi:topoisomerase IA-like protein